MSHYPNVLLLFFIVAILPIGNAVCERGFSAMNDLKNKKSNRMHEDTTELRMILRLRMPPHASAKYEPLIVAANERYWRGRKT